MAGRQCPGSERLYHRRVGYGTDVNARDPDHGSATWDEFVGMWLTCLLVPFGSPVWLAGAFVVFRAFDVLKPWPCRRLERLPRGWGIMLDDVGAGLWAALVMVACLVVWQLIEPVAPGPLRILLAN